MDLLTLIAACALSVEPNVMHALIFEQSAGEPWLLSVPSEGATRVLPMIQDAIRAPRWQCHPGWVDRARNGVTLGERGSVRTLPEYHARSAAAHAAH
jgi:hypothetical protein